MKNLSFKVCKASHIYKVKYTPKKKIKFNKQTM